MKRARCSYCFAPITAAEKAKAKRGGRIARACSLPSHAQQARRRRRRLAQSGLAGEALDAAIEREARATGERLAAKALAVPAASDDAEHADAPENAAGANLALEAPYSLTTEATLDEETGNMHVTATFTMPGEVESDPPDALDAALAAIARIGRGE